MCCLCMHNVCVCVCVCVCVYVCVIFVRCTQIPDFSSCLCSLLCQILASRQPYRVVLELELPESPVNLETGELCGMVLDS